MSLAITGHIAAKHDDPDNHVVAANNDGEEDFNNHVLDKDKHNYDLEWLS
jgi:hypothetical protein